MVCGIYCYKDTKNNDEIVYVGKDSNISIHKRHKDHYKPSNYNDQVINRILQNNPNRYTYHVLKQGNFSENLLNALEIIYTYRYNPKFSFTIGGDGSKGYKHSNETKKKISDALKKYYCSNKPMRKHREYLKGKDHPLYGKPLSEETRKKMSESRKGKFKGSANPMYGKNHSEETRKKLSESHKGKVLSDEHCLNISKSRNTSGYYRVSKQIDPEYKQGFYWIYRWNDNGKRRVLRGVDLDRLKEKILANGLEWIKLDEG